MNTFTIKNDIVKNDFLFKKDVVIKYEDGCNYFQLCFKDSRNQQVDMPYIFGDKITSSTIKECVDFVSQLEEQNKGVVEAIEFASWLMENCELAEDNSLWSYEGDDYTLEKLYKIFKKV